MTKSWGLTAVAATIAALSTFASARAGVLIDAASVFSIQGNSPGVILFDSANLNPNSSFNTAFKADGLAYQGGRVFVSGATSGGILSGNYLKSYDLIGGAQASVYGASFVDWGPLASGAGKLFAGVTTFDIGGSNYSIQSYNNDLTFGGLNIELPEEATGIAFSGGGLYVSFGSNIRHYDLSGNLIDGHDYGVTDVTGLAYGAGKLFAAFDSGASTGWATINPAMLWASGGASVDTDAPITGMTFGDNGLYVSTEFSLARYELDGDKTLFLDSTPVVSHGPLAFIPGRDGPRDPGAVPEPGTWALMLVGFGLAGGGLRRRRAPAIAA